jgi:predicted DNA-binding transcriptional regulator AlpA
VVIIPKTSAAPESAVRYSNSKKQRGHVLPRPPVIDINNPGRLRSSHVLALCGFSHSTLYSRMKTGDFPAPDGKDGGLNFWNTWTIKTYLENGTDTGELKWL